MPDLPSTDRITTDDISAFFDSPIQVHVLRLDKIHSQISGNKWFKLKYYLQAAINSGKGIATFGGAWSNHLLATAAACRLHGLRSIGMVRGEEAVDRSQTLVQCEELGMQLIYLSREDYRQKNLLLNNLDDYLLIPEGGYGELGAKGAATILDHTAQSYTHYCCAVGTGTMMAGLINAAPSATVIGISALKNNSDLEPAIRSLANSQDRWMLIHDYHFGGYAKHPQPLIDFINEFYQHTQIPADIVYTGKLFYAARDLVQKQFFPPGSRILLIHSGGLQGNASVPKGTLMF